MSFPQLSRAIRIFFSYATTRDKNLCDKLRAQLSLLRRQGIIEELYDNAGARSNLGQYIETYLNKADIIVLLISAEFFASDRCYEVEMKRALELSDAGDAYVIPVLLRPTEWRFSPLDQYKPLPPDGKPVSQWSNKDAAWLAVASGIRKVVEDLAAFVGVRSRSSLPNVPLCNIPHWPNRFFTGREALLATLYDYFTSDQTFQQTHIQALNGLSGIGKTQLAIEYAACYQHEYHSILWVKASSRDILSAEIASLAELLGLPAKDRVDEQRLFPAVRRWLQRHDRWLLIIDDLESFELIHLFVPPQSNGHVLLTTLSPITGPLARAVTVMQMTTEEGALFLLRRAKIIGEQALQDKASEANFIQAKAIAQQVDGFPLALDQAGAYIEETGRSLAEYFSLYHEQRATLLRQRGQFANGHPDPVTVTFSLAFEKVAIACPEALDLLRLFAFLHPDAIPKDMIQDGASALDDPLQSVVTDSVKLDKAIAALRNFSLVYSRADTTTLSIHRIVQNILIDQLTIEQQSHWAVQVVCMVNYVFPEGNFSTWAACERYLSQAQKCVELIADFQLVQHEAGSLLQRLGSYCYQRACYREAERYLTHALRLSEQNMGPEHLETARTLNTLGLLYDKQGKYSQAEALYQRALAIREQVLSPNHAEIAQTLNNLAIVYKDQGNYQQAQALYQRVLTIDEQTRPDHPDTAKALNNLALVHYEQGKYSQAEVLYQRALDLYHLTVGLHHPDAAQCLNNLAVVYDAQARYQEAEVLYRQALATYQQSVGSEHPATAQSLNNLAGIYEIQGNYQEAETLYLRVLTIYEQAFGPDHPDVALGLNNLAYLYDQQERYHEAERLYKRSLEIYEQAQGPEHPDTAHVLNNLGRLYRVLGDDKCAESFLRRALAIRQQVPGASHPDTARSLSNLAELLVSQNHYEQAEALFQQALAIYQQASGPEHTEVALLREYYASLLERMNRGDEAEALRQATWSIKDSRAPEHTPEHDE